VNRDQWEHQRDFYIKEVLWMMNDFEQLIVHFGFLFHPNDVLIMHIVFRIVYEQVRPIPEEKNHKKKYENFEQT
jgi:hypothetical protein